MSRRDRTNRIRGPQSALTDFLAQYNISAAQIRDSYQERLQAAREAAAAEAAANPDEDIDIDALAIETVQRADDQARAIEAAEEKKSKKKSKKKRKKGVDEDSDDDATFQLPKMPKVPGQLANCGNCEVRFTVTPYSKANTAGDLLCAKCSKELAAKEPPRKRAANRDKRRVAQSNILDGRKKRGARSLVDLCVRKVGDCIDDVDELGDMPPELKDSIAMILSKNRSITSRTHRLFLEQDDSKFALYDCAKLTSDDFKEIATKQPLTTDLTLRNCGQVKDNVIDHWIDNFHTLEKVHLEGPNLVSDEAWLRFFSKFGQGLSELRISWIDHSFSEEVTAMMIDCCPNLRVLKLKKIWRFGQDGIQKLCQLKNLEVLTILNRSPTITAEDIANLIRSVGSKLTTLSLIDFTEADDSTIDAIRETCSNLRVLKLTNNEIFTSAGLMTMFKEWKSPALAKADFRYCCNGSHQDNLVNTDGIGFDSTAFVALMEHSGSNITYLNVNSDRHIKIDALTAVFNNKKVYPNLRTIDMSFVGDLDDMILKSIERSCPALERIIVFGCWQLTAQVDIRPTLAVIGCLARDLARDQENGPVGGRVVVPDATDDEVAVLLSQEA